MSRGPGYLRRNLFTMITTIVRRMKGWTRDRVRACCAEKGWNVSVVHELERAKPW